MATDKITYSDISDGSIESGLNADVLLFEKLDKSLRKVIEATQKLGGTMGEQFVNNQKEIDAYKKLLVNHDKLKAAHEKLRIEKEKNAKVDKEAIKNAKEAEKEAKKLAAEQAKLSKAKKTEREQEAKLIAQRDEQLQQRRKMLASSQEYVQQIELEKKLLADTAKILGKTSSEYAWQKVNIDKLNDSYKKFKAEQKSADKASAQTAKEAAAQAKKLAAEQAKLAKASEAELSQKKELIAKRDEQLQQRRKLLTSSKEFIQQIELEKKLLSDTAKVLGKTSSEYAEQKVNLDRLNNSYKEFKTEQKTAAQAAEKLEKENIKITNALNKQIKSIADLKVRTNALVHTRDKLDQSTVEGQKEFARLTKEIHKNEKRLKNYDASIDRFQRNVGNYKSAITGLSTSFSKLTSIAGGVGLALGGQEILSAGIEQLKLASKEIATLQKQLGTDNPELINNARLLTAQGQDLTQVLDLTNKAAINFNTNSTQALADFDEIISKGSVNADQYLSVINEYSSSFEDAGLNIKQAGAFLIQFDKSGQDLDKSADTLREFTTKIRELTPTTEKALTDAGVNFKKLREEIANGTITYGDAFVEIAKLTDGMDEGTIKGQLLADVFGSQSEDITSVLSVAKDLNLELDELPLTITALEQANKRLALAWIDLSSGGGNLNNILANVIDFFARLMENVDPVTDVFKEIFSSVEDIFIAFSDLGKELGLLNGEFDAAKVIMEAVGVAFKASTFISRALYRVVNILVSAVIEGVKWFKEIAASGTFLGKVFSNVQKIINAYINTWKVMGDTISNVWNWYDKLITSVVELAEDKLPALGLAWRKLLNMFGLAEQKTESMSDLFGKASDNLGKFGTKTTAQISLSKALTGVIVKKTKAQKKSNDVTKEGIDLLQLEIEAMDEGLLKQIEIEKKRFAEQKIAIEKSAKNRAEAQKGIELAEQRHLKKMFELSQTFYGSELGKQASFLQKKNEAYRMANAALATGAENANITMGDIGARALANTTEQTANQVNALSERKDAYKSAFDIMKEASLSLLSTLSDAADRRVELITSEKEQSDSKLQTQIQLLQTQESLAEKGAAFNADEINKEIEREKARNESLEQERQKALKQQQAVARLQIIADGATQISGLITASANLYKSLSPLGPLGIALATAATGVMFGAFAASKVTAFNAAETPAFADGIESVPLGGNKKGKDTVLARVDEGERILSKNQNKRIQNAAPNLSNEEAVRIIENANTGNMMVAENRTKEPVHQDNTELININKRQLDVMSRREGKRVVRNGIIKTYARNS